MKEPAVANNACVCTPSSCHSRCALDVVDGLLSAQAGVRGDEMDLLLDFRFALWRAEDAGALLSLFFTLRRSMEQRHYLAFYRLRRWLENHLVANVRVCRGYPEREVRIALNRYCLEAVRSACVLQARQPGEPLLGTRVTFGFARIPLPEPCPFVEEKAAT